MRWDQWLTQPLSRLPATHCKFNFNICTKINQSAVGFPPNIYQSKDSNGSRGHEEGAPKQVMLAQYDRGNCSHHSVHLPHHEFYTSSTYLITDFDPQTCITLRGRGWIVVDGAFEHRVFLPKHSEDVWVWPRWPVGERHSCLVEWVSLFPSYSYLVFTFFRQIPVICL